MCTLWCCLVYSHEKKRHPLFSHFVHKLDRIRILLAQEVDSGGGFWPSFLQIATDNNGMASTQEAAEAAIAESIATINSGPAQDGDERYCWVCFATDEDDKLVPWVQPCNCRGATKWVYQSCLQRWVDENQKGNTFKRVSCPQCQIEYIIVLPSMGALANVLEGIYTLIKRISSFLTAGVIVGSIYWTVVTYGAVTVLQMVSF